MAVRSLRTRRKQSWRLARAPSEEPRRDEAPCASRQLPRRRLTYNRRESPSSSETGHDPAASTPRLPPARAMYPRTRRTPRRGRPRRRASATHFVCCSPNTMPSPSLLSTSKPWVFSTAIMRRFSGVVSAYTLFTPHSRAIARQWLVNASDNPCPCHGSATSTAYSAVSWSASAAKPTDAGELRPPVAFELGDDRHLAVVVDEAEAGGHLVRVLDQRRGSGCGSTPPSRQRASPARAARPRA